MRYWLPAALVPFLVVLGALDSARPVGRPWETPCVVPPLDCEEGCDELVWVSVVPGPGYKDVPVPDERDAARSTSWLRRDLFMVIRHAAARVACTYGGLPLELGDMSERYGAIPGTAAGRPRHPFGSHLGGHDIDVAYYQLGPFRNSLNPVCPHMIDGIDQAHCVGHPARLDVRRTALFIGTLFESPGTRIVGVDGRVGPILRDELNALCDAGTFSGAACDRIRLGYETEDTGRGWYHFHYAHMHVSWWGDRRSR